MDGSIAKVLPGVTIVLKRCACPRIDTDTANAAICGLFILPRMEMLGKGGGGDIAPALVQTGRVAGFDGGGIVGLGSSVAGAPGIEASSGTMFLASSQSECSDVFSYRNLEYRTQALTVADARRGALHVFAHMF